MKFKVFYSQQKDIANYLNSVWHFSYQKYGRKNITQKLLQFYPSDFKQNLKSAQTKLEAKSVVKNYLTNLSPSFHQQTEVIQIGIDTILNSHSQQIVNQLESIYSQKFPFKNITVYITTLGICPYNYDKRWFMTRRSNSPIGHINTAIHELNHFMFYYYYQDYLTKKNLSQKNIEILKEALAILTNPEGNNKPQVIKIETYIKSLPKKPIKTIIDSCLEKFF